MNSSKSSPACEFDAQLVADRIAFRNEVFDWCLRNARKCMARERLNDALAWNEFAANVFAPGCSPLVAETLERNLRAIAQRIPVPEWEPQRKPGAPRRWLHVVDSFIPNGGHASMARRWILLHGGNNLHNVAFPFLEGLPVPEIVVDPARQTGGEIFTAEAGSSLLARSEWLRNLAFAKADCVVLHISSSNVIVPTAFGVDGGPPVLLVNHAAHQFWTGAPIVDLVLNCRGSQFEREWTEQLRAIPRSATLPIPLLSEQTTGESFSPEFRIHARQALGIPDDEVVLLTVGRDTKYSTMPGLNFMKVAHDILDACPGTRMYIVGLTEERWKRASENSRGRLISVGRVSDLSLYHAAADVYLEGFPLGSTTALLEAGVHGIPCVLPPVQCPPPFATDGAAIDEELERPANIAAYIDAIRTLVHDPAERHRRGQSLARSIREHHTSAGWQRYLADITTHLPKRHAVHPLHPPQAPPLEIQQFWETYLMNLEHRDFVRLFKSMILSGLRPRIDGPLYRACLHSRSYFRHREGRLQLIPIAVAGLLPLCPSSMRVALYDRLLSMGSDQGLVPKTLRLLRDAGSFRSPAPAQRSN